jgi:hypothetical protein
MNLDAVLTECSCAKGYAKTQSQGKSVLGSVCACAVVLSIERINVRSGKWDWQLCRVLMANYLISLRALLSLNNVKFYFVAFFQTFVPIDLDGAVVHENVRSIIASDKTVAFCVVEPFDLAFVLRHEPCPSLESRFRLGIVRPTCLYLETQEGVVWFSSRSRRWLSGCEDRLFITRD